MKIQDNILFITDKIDYDDCEEFLKLSDEAESIVVETNDIHPSIFQLLFCISKKKDIIVEDEFNKRFFENLEFVN